jgi:ribosomal protein L29
MKKIQNSSQFFGFAIGAIFIASITISCNNSPKDKLDNATTEVVEASADLIKAKEDYLAEVAAFKADAEKQIIANELKMEEYKNDIKIKKTSELKKKIEELKEKTADLKQKLADFKADDNKESWMEFRREFQHDMDGLGNALNDLTTQNTPK